MRILFVLEYYFPNIGGVETLFKTLAESLVSDGHQVTVVTMRFRNNLKKNENINGVEVVRSIFSNRYLFTLFGFIKVIGLASDFDLIQTTSYSAALPAVLAGKFKRKKVVITFHELWGKLWFKLPFISYFGKVVNFIVEQIYARLPYYKIVAVSDFTRNRFADANIAENKVVRIYNGLDYSIFADYTHVPPSNFTFTYFGRLGISKGLEILIGAAAQFLPENPTSRLKLIIPSRQKKMYRKIINMIKSKGIMDQVDLLSDLDRDILFKKVSESHCVVIPSYSEGFGFTAAEAAGLGVPVISSGCGALEEVVSGRYITMCHLSKDALYKALNKAKAGKWDSKDLKKFELGTLVSSYEKLYKYIIGNDDVESQH